jgi:magnesium transporter
VTIYGNAIYRDGKKVATPATLEETFEQMKELKGFAWIGLYRPTDEEVDAVAAEFGLHRLAVEDAKTGHQRAKLERYGDSLFAVLRPARYIDETEKVEFGEVNVFVGRNYVVTVRHAESPDLGAVRKRLEETSDLLVGGPDAVLYAIFDQVVDEYLPVELGLENDLDEIEAALFTEDTDTSRRIFELFGEVLELGRAVQPLPDMLERLEAGIGTHVLGEELQRDVRDVRDHALRAVERVDNYRQILESAMTVHHTRVGQRQNEEMKRLTEASIAQGEEVKKISSWAAIIFAPTLIAGIYGMNFDVMPELQWEYGYPYALGLMVAFAGTLYIIFKKKNWL